MAYQSESTPLPKFVERPRQNIEEKELDVAENISNWVWPISSWLIIIFNAVTACISVRDMWSNNYNPSNHYWMTIGFTLTLGLIAVIHRWILRGK